LKKLLPYLLIIAFLLSVSNAFGLVPINHATHKLSLLATKAIFRDSGDSASLILSYPVLAHTGTPLPESVNKNSSPEKFSRLMNIAPGAYFAPALTAPTDNDATDNYVVSNAAANTTVGVTAQATASGYSGVNLALGQPTFASGTEITILFNPAASNAVDGNASTRFSSNFANNAYITVDLGAVYNINEVKFLWEASHGTAYNIQTSTDNINFTTIRAATGQDGGTDDFTGLTGVGRYVRMQGVTRSNIFYGYSIYEFQVYGTPVISYSLTTNPGGIFQINSSTGVISVLSGTSLNNGVYNVQATASAGDLTTASNFTITAVGAPTAAGVSRCGAGAVSITAANAATGGTYNWYTAASGGTLLQSSASATYTTTLTTTTTFYVSYTLGGITSSRTAVTATINPIVSSPIANATFSYSFSGNTKDVSGNQNDGIAQNAPVLTTDRFGFANSAYSFNGTNQFIKTTSPIGNPQTFSISLWFNTTTTTGGRLAGISQYQDGTGSFDRHIYMNNAGQLYFGVYAGGTNTVNTTGAYNDGNWHHVVGTLSSTNGMKLYVDNVLQASNAAYTSAEPQTNAYWIIGGINLGGWPSASTSSYFSGKIDDVAIYSTELTAATISASNDVYQIGAYAPVCVGSPITIYSPNITGATYSWTDPSGTTATGQNPTFASAKAGAYTLTVTGGPGGCSSTATYTPTLLTTPAPTFTATAVVNTGSPATITLTSTPAAGDTYAWNFDGGTPSTASIAGPFSVTWSTYGTKTITLTITNSGGCSATTTQTINVATTASYGFSKPIVLNTSAITGGITTTLTNFPALVYIQDNALIVGNACADKVQYPLGNGSGLTAGTNYDFAFTLAGSTNELNYQVDTYDAANGILLAWVQIPSLTSSNQNLTFYFGSKNPTHNAAFSAATWASDYLSVYHFSEGSATATVLDATSNGRNATQTNTTISNDEIHVAAGIPVTGGGYSFNGTSSKIVQNAGTNPNITGAFTLSAWVLYNGTATSDNKIMSNELNYGPGYKLSVKTGKIESETRTSTGAASLLNTGTVSSGSWTYIQGVYDGTKLTNYVNGVASATTATASAPANGNVINLGVDYLSPTTATNYYNGFMDEVRISNAIKSADWIKTEYYNQKNPKTFTNYSGALTAYASIATGLSGALTYTWTGATSTDPTVATNWTNATTGVANELPDFTGGATLVIPTGLARYPSLTANATIYGLTVGSGASLNLNGFTLTVGCNIYNSGTGNILYNSNNASGITWAGSIAQSYTGSAGSKAQAANMTVNNSAGLNITVKGGNIDLYKLLTMTKGNLVVDNSNSGLLTLKSTAAQSANVDIIPATSSITGLVNVERFITGGGLAANRGYRILSSPVNQTSAVSSPSNTFGLSYLKDHTYYGNQYAGAYTGGIGGPAAGFSVTSVGPTVYLWDERQASNNQGYTTGKSIGVNKITTIGSTSATTTSTVDLSNGQTGVSIPVGNGFEIFFIGPSSRTSSSSAILPDDATLVANGYLNQQNVPVNLWYTPTGGSSGNLSYNSALGATAAGYNMVGNPYPSTINLQTVLTDNATAIDNIYLLSAKNYPNQTFIAFTANGTSAPSAGYAVSGEGFLVHAKATGQSMVFKEGEKSAATQLTGPALIMSAPKGQAISANGLETDWKAVNNFPNSSSSFSASQPLTGLYMKMEKDSLSFTYCGIYFGDQWLDRFQEGDAQDLNSTSNATVMSSFSTDGIRSAVKHFPDYRSGTRRIKLYVNGKTDGLYTLKMEGLRNIDTSNYKISLLDHYKKDSLDIGHYGAYEFNITKADTASFGGNRFELVFNQSEASKYRLVTFTAQKAANGVILTWKTYNEGNNYTFELEKQQTNGTDYSLLNTTQSNGATIYKFTDKTPNTGNNTYRLKQVNMFGNVTYSAPVTILYSANRNFNMLSVYPNPAAETLNILVSNSDTNKQAVQYKLKIYDATGNVVMQKTSTSMNWQENIAQFNPGIYIVQLSDINGSTLGQTKFIKK
jgi:hypothetical protein